MAHLYSWYYHPIGSINDDRGAYLRFTTHSTLRSGIVLCDNNYYNTIEEGMGMQADTGTRHNRTTTDGYTIKIARGDRSGGGGHAEFFYVPRSQHTTIITMLEWLRAHQDPSLMFRRSCYHGSCGTCGIMINGVPKLSCICKLSEYPVGATLTLDSLPTLPTYGDLASNPEPLYGAFPPDARYLRSALSKNHPLSPRPQHSHHTADVLQQQQPVHMERCIECSLCQSSCPVPNFMGPAVLSAYYRESVNVPQRQSELLARVNERDGASACQSHYHCSNVCPAGVYPSADIKKLQKQLAP